MPSASIPYLALRVFTRFPTRATQTPRCIRSLRAHKPLPHTRAISSSFRRCKSSSTSPEATPQQSTTSRPLTDRSSNPSPPFSGPRPSRPEYQITFTCSPCGTRSSHKVSKQGYHHGSTLITCPDCRNRHIISDHLGIFGDKSMTIEDLMRERGQLVKKGTLSEDGDVEFWEDGTSTAHVNEGNGGGVEAEEQGRIG